MKILFLLFSLMLGFTNVTKEPKYAIVFTKVDNRVDVLINDSIVYSTGIIEGNPNMHLQVDITPFISCDEDKITIQVFNGSESLNPKEDTHWEVRYELLKYDELLDYVWEYEDELVIGKSFEMTHYLNSF